MNDATQDTDKDLAADSNVIEGSITEVKPDNALVVIDPVRYATELFAPFLVELATAKRSAARKTYDIKTDAGMEQAKELRTTFVKIRTRADKAKTEAKRPIDQAGKKILEIYNTVEAAAKAEEKKHNDVIVAREAEIAAEVQRKLDEERTRIEAIENRIAHIRNATVRHLKSDSAAIAREIEQYTVLRLDPTDYQELLEDALNAVNKTLDDLEAMRLQAVGREEAERKAEADRIELARLREETAARERREAEEKAEREAEAKRQSDVAAEAAAANAKLIADLQAQLAAAQKAAEPAPATESVAEIDQSMDRAKQAMEGQPYGVHYPLTDDPVTSLEPVSYADPASPVPPSEFSFPAASSGNAASIFVASARVQSPGESEIITVVAIHFGVRAATAINWMASIDYDKARAALAEE